MPLSFAALLPSDDDLEMRDVSATTSPPAVDVPLTFDFDFEFGEPNLTLGLGKSLQTDDQEAELRSPRTPTYDGDPVASDAIDMPFDVDKFFKFPLLSPSLELSPLTTLSHSPAAKSRGDVHIIADTKEKHAPLLPPPKIPLLWIWTCHLCHSRYPIGATRRCLIDGHFYCSGDNTASTQRNVKKKKRGQACSSEFDYVGWQEWGVWKGKTLGIKRQALAGLGGAYVKSRSNSRSCETCEYPSQCRYERMNKIPDVVAAVSKQGHHGEGGRKSSRISDPASAAKKDSKVEKPKHLTIDTGTQAGRASRSKDRVTSSSELKTIAQLNGEVHTPLQREQARCKIQSPNPRSPDLVDFSKLLSASSESKNNVNDKNQQFKSLEIDSIPVDQKCSSDSSSAPKESASNALEPRTYTATAPVGLKRLTRTKTRKRSMVTGTESVKQSRISDFFGITK